MDQAPPSYLREFASSPHHVVFGLLTLGAGFLSGAILPLIAGATAYSLGWIYLPDMSFFRAWVDRKRAAGQRQVEQARLAEFLQRRTAMIASLASNRRERYARLVAVCRDIEKAGADQPRSAAEVSTDPRLRKLDELMWTYLRLLSIEESLERFLETERTENVPDILKNAEAEVSHLNQEVESMKKSASPVLESRQRYLGSRLDRLEVLRKRLQRLQQAEENLALVLSEQDRLDQQIKLIRADAVATKNAATLTARIDATVQHLDQTNKWLSELDEFKDLVGDLPATESRVGYEPLPTTQPPPVPPVLQPTRSSSRQRQTQ